MIKNSKSIFLSLLLVLFIGLKITGNIDWSWWWVVSPIWIPLGLGLLVVGIVLLVSTIKNI